MTRRCLATRGLFAEEAPTSFSNNDWGQLQPHPWCAAAVCAFPSARQDPGGRSSAHADLGPIVLTVRPNASVLTASLMMGAVGVASLAAAVVDAAWACSAGRDRPAARARAVCEFRPSCSQSWRPCGSLCWVAAEKTTSGFQPWISVRRSLVHVPAGDHSRADHDVADPGQVITGVGLESKLQELVRLAATAFPPVDEGYCG
jgi:hypothetical protein